jgi:hypothetical protein
MPSANYQVAFVLTSDTDFGGNAGWGYLFVTGKTANGFTFNLNDSGGTAKNAPADTTVDWLALPSN